MNSSSKNEAEVLDFLSAVLSIKVHLMRFVYRRLKPGSSLKVWFIRWACMALYCLYCTLAPLSVWGRAARLTWIKQTRETRVRVLMGYENIKLRVVD